MAENLTTADRGPESTGQKSEYDALPESIKAKYTREQYAWLGSERYRIIERETMPDWDVTE